MGGSGIDKRSKSSKFNTLMENWRRVPESNRSSRICNPLRNLSANPPERFVLRVLGRWRQGGVGQRCPGRVGLANRAASADPVDRLLKVKNVSEFQGLIEILRIIFNLTVRATNSVLIVFELGQNCGATCKALSKFHAAISARQGWLSLNRPFLL
jgi:hypothetical protein